MSPNRSVQLLPRLVESERLKSSPPADGGGLAGASPMSVLRRLSKASK
jgi:hypothetical protein